MLQSMIVGRGASTATEAPRKASQAVGPDERWETAVEETLRMSAAADGTVQSAQLRGVVEARGGAGKPESVSVRVSGLPACVQVGSSSGADGRVAWYESSDGGALSQLVPLRVERQASGMVRMSVREGSAALVGVELEVWPALAETDPSESTWSATVESGGGGGRLRWRFPLLVGGQEVEAVGGAPGCSVRVTASASPGCLLSGAELDWQSGALLTSESRSSVVVSVE